MDNTGRLGGGSLIAQVTQVILFLHLNRSGSMRGIVIINPRGGTISYVQMYIYMFILYINIHVHEHFILYTIYVYMNI